MSETKTYKLTDQQKQDAREAVFAFAARLAPIYRLLNWKWGAKGEDEVPDEERIRETLLYLLNNVVNGTSISSSTGGLFVGWSGDDNGFSINFDLEGFATWGEEDASDE